MRSRCLAVTLVASALAGCGGDDAASDPEGPPPTREEAEQVYRDFYAAMLAGDPEAACALLTEGAQEELVAQGNADDMPGDSCAEVAEQTSSLMRSFGAEPEITFGTLGEGSAGDVAIEATVGDAAPRMIPVERHGDDVLIAGFGS